MTFHVDISNTFELCSTLVKNYVWKVTKGNNSKIRKGRVIILVHCTPPQWDHPPMKFQVDISNTFEISSGQNSMKKNNEKNKVQLLKNCIGKSYHSCAQHSSSIRSIQLWHFMLTSETLLSYAPLRWKIKYEK
jgi:hypothetical protein